MGFGIFIVELRLEEKGDKQQAFLSKSWKNLTFLTIGAISMTIGA